MKKVFFLFVFSTSLFVHAQNLWSKVPQFPASVYSDDDGYHKKISDLIHEMKTASEQETEKAKASMQNMSEQERLQIAMKMSTQYQNMKPEEIVRMQQEQLEMSTLMAQVQQQESDFDTRYQEIKDAMEAEMGKALGPIEAEYNKLPDGEGTPDWAIKKGQELNLQYNHQYEAICTKYITGANSLFKKWLEEYKTFLITQNTPAQIKIYTLQQKQMPVQLPVNLLCEMDMVRKYAEKCQAVYGYRKSRKAGGWQIIVKME